MSLKRPFLPKSDVTNLLLLLLLHINDAYVSTVSHYNIHNLIRQTDKLYIIVNVPLDENLCSLPPDKTLNNSLTIVLAQFVHGSCIQSTWRSALAVACFVFIQPGEWESRISTWSNRLHTATHGSYLVVFPRELRQKVGNFYTWETYLRINVNSIIIGMFILFDKLHSCI